LRDERWVNRFMYLATDSLFYEAVDTYYLPTARNFSSALGPEVQQRAVRDGIWWVVRFEKSYSPPPNQGWKVHVSAHPRNAERVLSIVAVYLVEIKVTFKFALDFNILELLNSKAMARGSSGKFITIYPGSLTQFREVIEALAARLSDEQGPYVLSDMRYKDSRAVYFRYGAFSKSQSVDPMGRQILSIITPSQELIPDRRDPYFSPPDWAQWPFEDWAMPGDDNENGSLLAGNYEVQEALSFSNTGGVYKAKDRRSRKTVVVKEARPFTNFSAAGGYDAVDLLRKEWDILQLLKDTGVAPKPVELFQEWEYHYLVEEYIEGIDIRTALFKRSHPLLQLHPNRRDSARYLRSFFRLFLSLAQAMQKVHQQGVLLGDLSANNLLLKRNSYRVVLIDFEASLRESPEGGLHDRLGQPILLYTPGFRRMDRASGQVYDVSDDLFSLASIMCYYIYPISACSALRSDLFSTVYRELIHDMGWPEKLHTFLEAIIKGRVGLKEVLAYLEREEARLVQEIRAPLQARNGEGYEPVAGRGRGGGGRVRRSAAEDPVLDAQTRQELRDWIAEMTRFIEAAADPSRATLFPTDPFAALTNPLSLGFGTGGVLYALQKAGYPLSNSWRQWFVQQAEKADATAYPPGLLTGLAGLALVLQELGEVEAGARLLEQANHHSRLEADYTLYYGTSGVGLANLKFYLVTGDGSYFDSATRLYQRLRETAQLANETAFWANEFTGTAPFTGLGFGQSGVALFLLRMHQLLKDDAPLRLGQAALRADLAHAVTVEPGVVSFRHEGTLEPYLEVGGAGIAKVLLRYGWFEQARPVLADLYRKYFVLPGYLFGASGVIDALLDAYLFTGDPGYLRKLRRPLEGLGQLHLFRPKEASPFVAPDKIPEGIAVPGEGLLRVSCDFGTGCAGVLRVLHRLLNLDQADFMLDEVDTYENLLEPAGQAKTRVPAAVSP